MNANYSCIPFYQSIDDLDHFKEYAFGDIYNNCCDKKLLPFQIVRMGNFTNISSVKLYNINMSGELDITTYMVNAGLYIKTFTAYSIIIFPANVSIPELPLGQKILKITDGATTYYSDVILIMDSVSDKLCLKWSNDKDLTIPKSRICYENNFFNYVYFDTEIGKPEYPFEEEQETLNGLKFPIQQISKKTYKFSVIIPEYLADVLRLVRMHDNIVVQLKNKQFICFNFLITIENTEQGNLFLVTAEFEEDSLVKRNAKAFSLLDADFNGDYNLDYLTDEFDPSVVSLKINTLGNGVVNHSPVKPEYVINEIVNLEAVPNVGETFSKWVINGSDVLTNPYNLTMDSSKIVDAHFTENTSSLLLFDEFKVWTGAEPYSTYPLGWYFGYQLNSPSETTAYIKKDSLGLKFIKAKVYKSIYLTITKQLSNVVSGEFKLTLNLGETTLLPSYTNAVISINFRNNNYDIIKSTYCYQKDFNKIIELSYNLTNLKFVTITLNNMTTNELDTYIVKSIKLEKIN